MLLSALRLAYGWVVTLSALAFAAAPEGDWYSETHPIMGTRVSVEAWHVDAALREATVARVIAEMHRIDALMSPYKADSELSKINATAGKRVVEISREMLDLLLLAARVSEMTHGAFDVTYASVGRFYDYREGTKPTSAELSTALEAIDYRYVELDAENSTVRYRHPQVYVDLGGIAKGYAVDRGIEILQRHGIEHGSVAAGGDSRILGDRKGRPWTVGVKHPRRPDQMAVVLPLEDSAVSTSGDYERYFEENGVRYHHILDPKTGESARKVQSVTVLGSETVFTDALSTSIFVLGPGAGLALVNTLPNVDAIIIDGTGELHFSDGLTNL